MVAMLCLGREYDLGQVRNRRSSIEIFQHAISAGLLLQPCHFAGGVLHVAEDDRVRRTGLGTGGGKLAVSNGPVLQSGGVLGTPDALNAEGALLHDAAGPDGHVWIELEMERLRPGHLVVLIPVEVADLVRTIVGAISYAVFCLTK